MVVPSPGADSIEKLPLVSSALSLRLVKPRLLAVLVRMIMSKSMPTPSLDIPLAVPKIIDALVLRFTSRRPELAVELGVRGDCV